MAESATNIVGVRREDIVESEFASDNSDPTENVDSLYWYAAGIIFLENVVVRHNAGTLPNKFTLVILRRGPNDKIVGYRVTHPNYVVEFYGNKICAYGHMQNIGTITMFNVTRGTIRNVSPHTAIMYMSDNLR